MSTYASSMKDVTSNAGDFLDVAYDVYGRDVRICAGQTAVYVSSDVARTIAEALTRTADLIDSIDPDDPWGER